MGQTVPINRQPMQTISLKTQVNVWLIYAEELFNQHMRDQLLACPMVQCLAAPLNDLSPLTKSGVIKPDLILVEAGEQWAEKVAQLHQMKFAFDGIEASLVVFGDEQDTHALKVALKLGASDFVSKNANLQDLSPLLIQISQDKLSNNDMGELSLFINSKGGAGTTTVVLNSALALANKYPDKVLLLDLDLQYGVVATYMDVKPKYNLFDVMSDIDNIDQASLSGLVFKHPSGLHMLSCNQTNMFSDISHKDNFSELISLLLKFYAFILVDFSHGVPAFMNSIFHMTSKTYIVCQQDIISLRNASMITKALNFEHGLDKNQIELVINRYEKRHVIKAKDIEKTLPEINYHFIPNDFKLSLESINLGQPIILHKKNSLIAKSFVELAQYLNHETVKSDGWLKRLWS